MTDRELLELAAKAAGIEWVPAETEKGLECDLKFGLWLRVDGEPYEGQRRRSNPLNNDGDALRLAVRLGLVVDCSRPSAGQPFKQHAIWLDETCDSGTLTRRAITLAAAEIGRGLM